MRNSEVQRLFNTSAKPLKYLPSYSLQTRTLRVAEFQIVLQNGFMDCTSLPESWQSTIFFYGKTALSQREKGKLEN